MITELTRSFNHSDLLPTVRYNDGVSALLKDGRIVFGGKGGIVIFNPLDFKPKANSAQLAFTNVDEAFLIKAMEVVQEHLSDEEFSADHFAEKMAMSRVHLYRKLKSLTGESVSDFVKTIRLKLAADLIRNKKVSIKETAYMVGFSDPKYFSKCFRQQFGCKPSDYAERELVE